MDSLESSDYQEEESFDEENIVDIRESGLKTFKEIESRCKKHDIQVLKVANNRIPKLDRKFFDTFPTIKFLDISGNLLSDINGIELLEDLVLLDISKNQVTSLKGIDKNKNLKRILASKNQIKNIEVNEVMANLVVLDLHKNLIENLDFGHEFPSLKELYVSDCNLKNLDGINNFPLLKHFIAAHNELTILNPINHPNLKDINLEGCLIKSFMPFQGCKSLVHINLSFNPIDEIGFASLYPMPTVRSIKLNYTRLTDANFITKVFPNIEVVDISGCYITKIEDFAILVKNAAKLRLLDTRWNPASKNLYMNEDISKGTQVYESIEIYDDQYPEKIHRRHNYRNQILANNDTITILDGIKVNSNVVVSESTQNYEEDEEKGDLIELASQSNSYEEHQSQSNSYEEKIVETVKEEVKFIEEEETKSIINEEEENKTENIEEEEDKQEKSEEKLIEEDNIKIVEEEEESEEESVNDNMADDEESVALTIPTYSTIGTQATTSTSSNNNKTKLTEQEAAPTIEIEAIDDNTKEEFIKKLKIQNEHLENELNQYKKFNNELQNKINAKEELQQLKESTEIREKQIETQLETIESSIIKPNNTTRNSSKSETYSKLLDALTQQNAVLVHELRKMRHKSKKKKYPSYTDVVHIVDYLLGGNDKMMKRMKERTMLKRQQNKLDILAEKLEEQNELMKMALVKSSRQKSHHHYNHDSYISYETSSYESIPRHHHHKHKVKYITYDDENDYKPRHKQNHHQIMKRPTENKSSMETRNFMLKSDTIPSIYAVVGDVDVCERKILGCARQPLESQYHVTLDPNCKEARLLLMFSQFSINRNITRINVIKAATTEKFIEAEYRAKRLRLFFVPCDDPPLFFDGFFPKSIVAFRKFRCKPQISTFLVICYDDEKAIFVETPPQPSDEPKFRRQKVSSVNFVNGGCDTLLILDTKNIVPLYSISVY